MIIEFPVAAEYCARKMYEPAGVGVILCPMRRIFQLINQQNTAMADRYLERRMEGIPFREAFTLGPREG